MNTEKLKELLAALAIEGPAFAGVSLGRDGTPAVVHDGDSVLCEFPGWPRHHGRARAMAELLNALPSLIARLEAAERLAARMRNVRDSTFRDAVTLRGAVADALTTYDETR